MSLNLLKNRKNRRKSNGNATYKISLNLTLTDDKLDFICCDDLRTDGVFYTNIIESFGFNDVSIGYNDIIIPLVNMGILEHPNANKKFVRLTELGEATRKQLK